MTLPMSHAYGLLVTVAGMHSPELGIAVLLRWFDPAAFLSLIAEHRLELSAVVPSMLQILLASPLEQHDLSSLRYLTSGGAPLAPDVEREFRSRVPTVSLRQGYGLTECAALISTNPPGRERTGSVGLPVPLTELEIRGEDGGSLPAGEIGEVCARSPGVMVGYWRAPEATAEAVRDGWLYTGDVGYVDDDGYLFLVDRKKDLIIRGGFNVYPRDVEDALVEHPAVQMAGVIGRQQRRPWRRGGGLRRAPRGCGDRRRATGRLGARADRRLQVSARGPLRRRDPADTRGQDRSQGSASPAR